VGVPKYLIVVLLLAGCASTPEDKEKKSVLHTRSLLCIIFCASVDIDSEHNTKEKGEVPKDPAPEVKD
jgi:hypothetical protein